jgi:hypothetical protein
MSDDNGLQEPRRTRRVAYGVIAAAPITTTFASYLFGVYVIKAPNAGLHVYLSPLLMTALAVLHSTLAVVLFRLCLRWFDNRTGCSSLGMLFKYIVLTSMLLIVSGFVTFGMAAWWFASGSWHGRLAVAGALGLPLLLEIEKFVGIGGIIIGCFFAVYLRTRRLIA